MKRIFDVAVIVVSAVVWIPVGLVCAALILFCDGRPIFYKSIRQVGQEKSIRVLKFRTMRRDADKIVNRDTVPLAGVRFLNISPDSPLYTPIGRVIERFGLTELPQLLHVIGGTMSLVGNRPLPARVMEVLRQDFPNADDRFLTKAGLTGVVQLVGREAITDADRLSIEMEYCHAWQNGYSVALDLWLLIYTVLLVSGLGRVFTVEQVRALLRTFSMPTNRALRTESAARSGGQMPSADEPSTGLSPEEVR
jgi:lipopolysaccharide/colanic/teichoic acid biosynthesis glycosyltransferase